MEVSEVVWVWGTMQGGHPAPPPTVSVSAWPHLFGKQWLRFPAMGSISRYPEETQPGLLPIEWNEIRRARVAFVNLFHTSDSMHIQAIKFMNPACFVVAMPDAPLDTILSHPDWLNMHRQMALADAIAGRTHADCDVYGTLLDKPTFYLPSPIGPTEWFVKFRELPKGDYILSLDHPFGTPNSYNNVAALVAIQRETGLRVIYACENAWTREYAKLAGLKADFLGYAPFENFVALTAEARFCVDIYPVHSYGRQQVLSAMVGTPCISSSTCTDAPGDQVTPFAPKRARLEVIKLLDSPSLYRAYVTHDMDLVEKRFSFDASRKRLLELLEQIQVKA